MTKELDEARKILKQHWGFDAFRPAQEKVIEAILAKEDVLAVLATGYGKSVCFQIPAVMSEGCAIVVSPLIALMKDQVDAANAKGIPSSYINSHVDPDEIAERLGNLRAGAFKLFYVAPERLRSKMFRGYLKGSLINLIAIDEAHCASMWGHDFRPAFSRLHEISSMLWDDKAGTRPPILAVTATATFEIEDDIATALGMTEEYVRVVGDPVRPNLHYKVEHPQRSEWGALMMHARDRFYTSGRHLVYCGTRGACEKVAEMLSEHFPKHSIGVYHGGMERDERIRVQEAFVGGPVRIVCATNAFGMGIDVPDIRTVLHLGVPGAIESYVQETGRAGRDGKDAHVVLVWSDYSADLQHKFIDDANPPIDLYAKVWDWLQETLDEDSKVLRMSGSEIASRIDRETLSSAQVSTILNVLEANGLVEREYYDGGAPIVVNVRAMTDALDDEKTKTKRFAVMRNLLALARSRQDQGLPNRVLLDVEKGDLAFDAQCSESTVGKILRELDADDLCDVGRTFTGKTTKIKVRGEIEDLLPTEELKKKRQRDLLRFQAMVDYCHANDPKKFIRDYFKGRLDASERRKPSA